MSSTSTVYDVKVRYTLDDKARKGVEAIGHAASKSADHAWSLKGALAALGGIEALHKGKELLIDFNQEMENLKISMTTVMTMNMHMPFEKASSAADKLFDTFQDMAKKSPLMTKDFMQMGAQLAGAVGLAGGGVGKLQEMTKGALMAGLAFNVRPDQMQMDIQEMLGGNVRLSSRTARQLLASQNIDHKDFNALSPKKRAEMTEKILTDPAIGKASERMSHTFAGEMSTVKDNIQIALGTVGMPLMQQMTAEVKKWNTWIEKHPATIAKIGANLSDMLTRSFTFIKDAIGFLVDNKETILGIGKIFLVFKGTQMATNAVGGFVKGIASFVSTLKEHTSSIGGAFGAEGEKGTGLLGGIAKVGKGFLGLLPAIGALTATLFAAGGWIKDNVFKNGYIGVKDKKQGAAVEGLANDFDDLTKITKELRSLPDNELNRAKRTELIDKLNDPVFAGPLLAKVGKGSMSERDFIKKGLNAKFDQDSYASGRTFDSAASSRAPKDYLDVVSVFARGEGIENKKLTDEQQKTAKEMFTVLKDWHDYMSPFARKDIYNAAFDPTFKPIVPKEGWGQGNDKPEVNVTIQKIEVASEDPDRFVFGLVQIAEQAMKHPTQSQHTTAGGF